MFSTLEWTEKNFMQFLKQLHKEGGRALTVKNLTHKSVKTLKVAKTKQSNLISCWKHAELRFDFKIYSSNSGIEGGRGWLFTITYYINRLDSNIVPLALPPPVAVLGRGWGRCIHPTSLNITCICIILNIKKKSNQ